LPTQIFIIINEISEAFLKHYFNLNNKFSDQYKQQIKPINYILKIYLNIFSSGFVQLDIIKKIHPNMVESISIMLTQLIFSMKSEDIFGYVSKTGDIFKILKIIYIDFFLINISELIVHFDKFIKVSV